MAVTKRDLQLMQERMSRVETQLRALDARMKALETILKPVNLVRRVREGEEEEKSAKARGEMLDMLRPEEPKH